MKFKNSIQRLRKKLKEIKINSNQLRGNNVSDSVDDDDSEPPALKEDDSDDEDEYVVVNNDEYVIHDDYELSDQEYQSNDDATDDIVVRDDEHVINDDNELSEDDEYAAAMEDVNDDNELSEDDEYVAAMEEYQSNVATDDDEYSDEDDNTRNRNPLQLFREFATTFGLVAKLTDAKEIGGRQWTIHLAHSACNCVGKLLQWMLQLHFADNEQLHQLSDNNIVSVLMDNFLSNTEVYFPRYIHEYLGKQHCLKPKSQLNQVGTIKMILQWYLQRLKIEM